MILNIKVKAGIMLYALLLSSLFLLLLQFYTNQVISYQKQNQALLTSSRAYLMAEYVRGKEEKQGEVNFTQGQVRYQRENNQLIVTVLLDNREYHYNFREEFSSSMD
ncbi:competence type IV pilus minor pilin ComGG [Streptococcus cuniculipharyngis]|uniref:Competence protein ComGG n=1 Tax=Streptococcus cuniculipharyngis TaxID=1562651 RepID=A0A5C5SA18_9STRE|nr:competence type IV pilus minor pilin ComGG [Streptococcus cuniculipharyngis]TWS97368.1 competence protein ComGG [Streptococcus cuniculipharyngis]